MLIFPRVFLRFLLHQILVLHTKGKKLFLLSLDLKLSDFKISFPILISFMGLSDKDTLRVSPMPSKSKTPRPIDDFTLPGIKLPDSVMPKCKVISFF